VARDRQRAKQRKARRARNPGPAPSQPRRENVPGELEHASGEVDEFEAALVAGADGEPETAEPEAAEVDTSAREAAEAEAAEVETSAREAAEAEAAEADARQAAKADAARAKAAEREADARRAAEREVDARRAAEPEVAADDAEPGPEPDDGEGYPQALSDEDFDELEDEIDERVEEDEELEDDDDRGRRRAAATTGAAATPARRPAPAPGQVTQKGAGRFVAFLRASWAELQRVQWPDRRQVGQATAVVLGFVIIAGAYLGLADRVASEIVDLII
jgi:preprotein translocase SecE subunit